MVENYNKIAVKPNYLDKNLEDLEKYTFYKIVVCPYTENGNGVPSSPHSTRTMEDGKN